MTDADTNLGAHYRLLEKVGAGATGVVWRAEDRRSGQIVAAKILRTEYAEDTEIVSKFLKERTILMSLDAPGIVSVKDLVAEGDRLAIVMEFVPGGSLRNLLKQRGTLSPAEALTILTPILEALSVAQQHSVVHRDVKPDNVLITAQWERAVPGAIKLTDFGISSLIDESSHHTTALVGTPEYMAPELLAYGQASYPADVYGAGIMLYEMLAGRTPYEGHGTGYVVAQRHIHADPPRLDLPQPLWEYIEALLAKHPERRPSAATAAATVNRLQAAVRNLPALPRQTSPAEFAVQHGGLTVIRPENMGNHEDTVSGSAKRHTSGAPGDSARPTQSSETKAPLVPSVTAAPVDLGEAPHATVLRPVVEKLAVPVPRAAERARTDRSRPMWQKIIFAALAIIVMAACVVGAWIATRNHATPATPVSAELKGDATPTGLTVERKATYHPDEQRMELSLTYSTSAAPLSGPFLEIIGKGSSCPDVGWKNGEQKRNISANTLVAAPCGWAVNPGVVSEQKPVTVEGIVTVELSDATEEGVANWLQAEADRTDQALSDTSLSTTAYPAQRLQSIQVQVPGRVQSGDPLPVTVLPVWPGGVDKLNPIYVSPVTGDPTIMLKALTGGSGALRLIDGCGGAVAVSCDGETANALRPATQCELIVNMGPFEGVESNSFDIVGHGS